MKQVTKILMALVVMAVASSGFSQARNFRHERIIATDGFTGDGASVSNIALGNIVDLSSKYVATNNAVFTNAVALANSALQSEAYMGTVTGATIAAGSSDSVVVTGPNMAITWNTNAIPASSTAGATVGGHTYLVWTGPTCDTYQVSADGLYTNWMGSSFP